MPIFAAPLGKGAVSAVAEKGAVSAGGGKGAVSAGGGKGAVAQLVEQRTENPCVGGSIPPHTTNDLTQ